jgi:hypothetical protein
MGYAPAMFEEIGNLELPSKEVLDVGAQDVSIGSTAELEQLNGFISKHNSSGKLLAINQFPTVIEAREVYARAGFSYTCIDVDERPGTLRVDLARFDIPRPRSKYGLVVNVGTTEHLASPAATFALMHEMCAEGGILYNDVPLFGLGNHGLMNPTPKFWHALIWMNSYKALSVRTRTCDESAMDRGNFFHDYLDYMEGLRNIVGVSSLITAVLEKKTSWPFVVPFDAVFNDDKRGLSLAQLLIGSYRPFVATGAYTEQEVVAGINNFLNMNGRTFRLKNLDDFGPQDSPDPKAAVMPAPSSILDWLVARFIAPQPVKKPSQEPAQPTSVVTSCPTLGTCAAVIQEVRQTETSTATRLESPILSHFASSDDAVIKIAEAVDSGKADLANQLSDIALADFPLDWRLHQQKARALEGLTESASFRLALPVKELTIAKHLFTAAGLAAQDVDSLPRASSLISLGRSQLETADTKAANSLSRVLTSRMEDQESPLLIVLSTLPKSASAFIWMSLSSGLSLQPVRVSTWTGVDGYSEIIDSEELAKLIGKGGAVVQGHFFPIPFTTYAINTLQKILVHVRDPRQTVISWAHYLADPDYVGRQAHNNFAKVLSHLTLEDRVDWAIDTFLPLQIQYLNSWMSGVQNQSIKPSVHFLKQEDLVNDPTAYFNSILDFYSIDRKLFTHPESPTVGKLHFRGGKTDEWRQALLSDQITSVQRLVSDELLEFYGWER